eukprot:TRINITY_DN58369_c0_g1_i1.p1 TRINITY_DN58369_c0_g1~~TRINITY_DN58369_c0_g1_i1.p1  ORF type:complete len:214 (+),score=36.19 TRINITY_DN58369_c0_g1_i1:197-838(+)
MANERSGKRTGSGHGWPNPLDADERERRRKRREGPKSAQLLAKEEALRVNYDQHVDLSDEALQELLPRGSTGTILSIGSLLHDTEHDWPCTFYFTVKGCQNGMRCRFCHHKHPRPGRPGETSDACPRPTKRLRPSGGSAESDGSDDDEEEEGSTAPAAAADSRAAMTAVVDPARLDARGSSRPCWLSHDDRGPYDPPGFYDPSIRWPCRPPGF